MGRRGGPRPGVRFLVFGLAVPAVLCAAGCAGPGGPPPSRHSPIDSGFSATGSRSSAAGPGASPAGPGSSAAAARPASDADLCTRLVVHWSREVLDGDSYGDYQSMGLSNGQYEILRDVVDAARPLRHRQGRPAADELITRQARAGCTERYRHGTPSSGPWT
ncbi:hypothetical protein [Streptomyces capoamus]|uniref:hypothetical protein n=1 Tax=Streptomyces capoamus TaxID=68183 RepID=UPI0033944EEA